MNSKMLQAKKRNLRRKINKIRKKLPGINLCRCDNGVCGGDYSCIIPNRKIINGLINNAEIVKDQKRRNAFEDWIRDKPEGKLTVEEKIIQMRIMEERISGMDYPNVDQDIFEN